MAGPPKAPDPPATGGAASAADDKFAWRQVYHKPDIAGMSALSRREEEALVKDAKAHARHVCNDFVAGAFFASPFSDEGPSATGAPTTGEVEARRPASRLDELTPSLLVLSSAYAACVEPRLVSALWACSAKQEEMNACLRPLSVPISPLSAGPARRTTLCTD